VVLLVAGLIVITNMTASVNERTREIGVFRAIGFRQSHVLKIILTEAFITSTLAGVCGYLIGWGASNIVAPLLTMDSSVFSAMNYTFLGFSVFLAVSVGIAASIFPAYKASRLDPTVALKSL
jgi:putative ABC transport system permease protein